MTMRDFKVHLRTFICKRAKGGSRVVEGGQRCGGRAVVGQFKKRTRKLSKNFMNVTIKKYVKAKFPMK